MSNHKNALKTAWNDVTGDKLTTAGKGSLDKYASGWDAIFKPKKGVDDPPTFTATCNCGQTVEVKGYNVEWNCIGCGEKCGIYSGGY